MVWAWVLWLPYALEALEPRTLLWFRHGCSGYRMLSNQQRYCGLGMDALVTVCSRTTNVIMVWAWVLWLPYVNMYVHVYKYICAYMHICILYIREQNPGILMELYPLGSSYIPIMPALQSGGPPSRYLR